MFSLLNIFRVVAFFEGVSYILLLLLATPYKYLLDDPQYVKLLGMPHGVLFMIYVILAYRLKSDYNWFEENFKKVLLMGIIPAGTFYLDKQIKVLSNG